MCSRRGWSKALEKGMHGRLRRLCMPFSIQWIGKPPGRLRRGETLRKAEKARKVLSFAFHKKFVSRGRFRPPAGGRGTFPHGKVPKGCRGRPKGAWNMAAPGPPVAKQQCTASLAGARPAGFTSVPGRATVAYGAADPSPGSSAPGYPWSVGKRPTAAGTPCSRISPWSAEPCAKENHFLIVHQLHF